MAKLCEWLQNKQQHPSLPILPKMTNPFIKIGGDSNDHNCLLLLILIHNSIMYWLCVLPLNPDVLFLFFSLIHPFCLFLFCKLTYFNLEPRLNFLSCHLPHHRQYVCAVFSCPPRWRPTSHSQPHCFVCVIPGVSLAWLSKAQLSESRKKRVRALVQAAGSWICYVAISIWTPVMWQYDRDYTIWGWEAGPDRHRRNLGLLGKLAGRWNSVYTHNCITLSTENAACKMCASVGVTLES